MNYYNPYYFYNRTNMGFRNGVSSFFSRNFNFGSILNGAQRALGLFNQALPLIKEVAPMMRNARTMFSVMNEFKKIDSPSNNISDTKQEAKSEYVYNNGGPTFFA